MFYLRTQSVFHRGHGVPFIAPEVFIHSVARRTREDASAVPRLFHAARRACFIAGTKCLSSRRRFSFIPWRAGRERTRLPFRGFFMPRAERVPSRARSAFHRAGRFFRAVAGWTREHAMRVPSRRRFSFIPWRAGRERSCLPFRGFLCL